MTRITPEAVVAAYEATRMKPNRGHGFYYHPKGAGYADAIGALVAQKCGRKAALNPGDAYELNVPLTMLDDLDLHPRYVVGFSAGWDGEDFPWSLEAVEQCHQGYADGQAAWAVVAEHFGLEVES